MVFSDDFLHFLKIKNFFLSNPPKLSCGFKFNSRMSLKGKLILVPPQNGSLKTLEVKKCSLLFSLTFIQVMNGQWTS